MNSLPQIPSSAALAVSFEQIPGATISRAKLFLLDTIGVTLAGRHANGAKGVIELAAEIGGKAEATILGTNQKTSAPFAAFANSFLAPQ